MAGVRYPIEMVQGVPSVQVNGVCDTGIEPVSQILGKPCEHAL
jgi:hypothetical protein